MQIPKDPVILLSYINTQLRDNYNSLEDLCKSLSLPQHEIVERLSSIGFAYNKIQNQFK